MEMNPKIFCTYMQSAAINVPRRKWQKMADFKKWLKYFITKVLKWQEVRFNIQPFSLLHNDSGPVIFARVPSQTV